MKRLKAHLLVEQPKQVEVKAPIVQEVPKEQVVEEATTEML